MRLTQEQIRLILDTISRLTEGQGRAFLYGSRLDDIKKGGDIDLLIETNQPLSLIERARIKMELESACCLPCDILALTSGIPPTPFQRIAQAKAVKLEMPR